MAEVAALVGDPARANMLEALMSGRALTATELAHVAGVAAPTASGHLAKLVEGRLLTVVKQGRHRYYRLASGAVAAMLEGLMALTVDGPPRHRPRSARDDALAHARTCYNHLAGRLGVALADALVARGHVVLDDDGGSLTPAGADFLASFGVDLDTGSKGRRAFCRPCLDWTERRWHIGGAVGVALAARCFDLRWIEQDKGDRTVTVTRAGAQGFAATFGVEF
ncbi:MAG TPA: winged helix-turn-helix domain-containing protein [Azospirillaceae bacterium]|nr:winged helix-turn-helix domain-containing protein [Azospirillaceae bacterium]